jgi:hypothetical protein
MKRIGMFDFFTVYVFRAPYIQTKQYKDKVLPVHHLRLQPPTMPLQHSHTLPTLVNLSSWKSLVYALQSD